MVCLWNTYCGVFSQESRDLYEFRRLDLGQDEVIRLLVEGEF